MQTQYKGPLGSELVPVTAQPLNPGNLSGAAVQVPAPVVEAPVPVNTQTQSTVPALAGAFQARALDELQEEPTLLETVGASIASWDTTRLAKRFFRPEFENDTPVDAYEFLQNLPIALDEDEAEYLKESATGVKAAEYAVQVIQDRREARRVAGQSPMVDFLAQVVDPVWLAVPPAIRLGRTGQAAGRVVAGAAGAGLAGAATALGEGPVSDEEIVLGALLNGAASAVLYRPGRGLVPADKDFPAAALANAANPRYKLNVDGTKTLIRTTPPGPETLAIPDRVDAAIAADNKARGLGEALQWNIRKTFKNYGPVGERISNLLFDNNSDLGLTSVEAHKEMVQSELRRYQNAAEDLMQQEMKARGYGLLSRVNPMKSGQAYTAQRQIERELAIEMYRREQYARGGLTPPAGSVNPRVKEMADNLDKMHADALKELKRAGVEGAEDIMERAGFLSRRWDSAQIENALSRLAGAGMGPKKARSKVNSLVASSLRRANPRMEADVASQIAQAIVTVTLNKGKFDDGIMNASGAQLSKVRDVLREGNVDEATIERALNQMRLDTDEAGKAGFLKHRMDLDYKAMLQMPNGEQLSIMDLIDNRVMTNVDQYAQAVSTQVAFARKGMTKRSDIEALRSEFLESIPAGTERAEAAREFDNTLAYMRGEPTGVAMNDKFRLLQAYTRSISLAWSGFSQLTEYANILAQYGMKATLKYAKRQIPGFREAITPDAESARTLNNVLAEHSVASLRLRPYISRFEDNYDLPESASLHLAAQPISQLVPYFNGMRYVHHAQAKLVGNLILDRLEKATRGNADAISALSKFGIDDQVLSELRKDIQAHGFEVDKWRPAVWAKTRPAFGKMMDAAVLRGRMGDMPAFALFDPIGKFLFTYRTFVLVAHNKLLAGGLARDGVSGPALIMMYQFPLAMLAVQGQAYVRGEGTLSEEDLVKRAIGQMGGLGLFSEPFKWATGQSNAIGAPGLIALDRAIKTGQSAIQGQGMDDFGANASSLIPLVSVVPFINGLQKQTRDQD